MLGCECAKLNPHRTKKPTSRAVAQAGRCLKRSPDAATVEDLRNFQLHLVDGLVPALNATLTGLKFFFDITLGRIGDGRMQPVKLPSHLAVV